jgi:hypothetical protein
LYKQCYTNIVSAINGQDIWPEIEYEEMLPPVYKRGLGRPKKLRRREPDEPPSQGSIVGRQQTTNVQDVTSLFTML